jgi:hypothetical protein
MVLGRLSSPNIAARNHRDLGAGERVEREQRIRD